ncbi:hypothetical protein NC651_017266 [Populus alba x Populus x berolinensis]|nr:hypothetical protein NC651_017266 [Populus alba x Populus x berolinensis]
MSCHSLLSFTLLLLTFVFLTSTTSIPISALPPAVARRENEAKYGVEFSWGARRSVVEAPISEPVEDSPVLVLAPKRTYRKDPLNDFKRDTGGWNISDRHYWAVLHYSSAIVVAVAGVGCVVLYAAHQERFHKSTTETLEYVVNRADTTVDKLKTVSDFIASAKLIGFDQVVLPSNVQTDIDQIGIRINSSASVLADKTVDNSDDIRDLLDSVRVALITTAAIMLLLTFLGFFPGVHLSILTTIQHRLSTMAFNKNIVIFFLIFMASCRVVFMAAVYQIDDSADWTSMSQNFHVDDTLVFNYNNQFHNVKQVTQQGFESCNVTSPIAIYTNGYNTITLEKLGHFYFICCYPGHCQADKRLISWFLHPLKVGALLHKLRL